MKKVYVVFKKDLKEDSNVIPPIVYNMVLDAIDQKVFEVVADFNGQYCFIKNKIVSWRAKEIWLNSAEEHQVVAAKLRGEL